MEFKYEDNRIYVENGGAITIAEITFPEHDGIRIINHTFVDECLRGEGIAGQLVERAAKKIREEGKKAKVTCSYAIRWFEKNKEYSDILV